MFHYSTTRDILSNFIEEITYCCIRGRVYYILCRLFSSTSTLELFTDTPALTGPVLNQLLTFEKRKSE